MENNEQKLSDYIDRLNTEKKPNEDGYSTDSEELKELYHTVKLVRNLKDPAMPAPDFEKKLVHTIEKQSSRRIPTKNKKWAVFISVACVAAIIALMVNFILPQGKTNLVHAMTEAFHEVKAYHGTIEIVEINANNESMMQAKLEVWADQNGHYYTKGLEGFIKGVITVNNGKRKWQIQPSQKQVQIFPAFPDGYRFNFELGNAIKEVKNAITTKVIGEDTIAGRKTSILQVTPKGGSPYRLWIDKETKLPLQKQTAMHHAIQYKITYTQIEFSNSIPEKLMTYQLPENFKAIEKNPEQAVTDMHETQEIVGFTPRVPEPIPDGYIQDRITVIPSENLAKIYYRTEDNDTQIIVSQGPSSGAFEPAPNAILGKINNHTAEIQLPINEEAGILGGGSLYAGNTDINSIRWQQDGFEFAVVGNTPLEKLALFAESLAGGAFKTPFLKDQAHQNPEEEVRYDLEIEKNTQKNVDAGSSPWRLDPVFVAHVFVSLKISPEGITGEYPINIENFNVIENNGTDAVIAVSGDKTPIKNVYLKRIIRQDSTGIWTVVGYDPI